MVREIRLQKEAVMPQRTERVTVGQVEGAERRTSRTMTDQGKVERMKDLRKEGHSHGLLSHYGPGVTRPLPGRTVGALDGQECES